jgi:ADP-ribosylglycohydrolase/protein-tyrosine phosphatase
MLKDNTEREILAGRLAGAAWGHLVGDAAGVPYEFGPPMAPEAVEFRGHGTHHLPAGTWSDDGALMLALLDALLPAGDAPGEADPPTFDLGRQAANALAWYDKKAFTPDGVVFDIGGTTSRALSNLRRGAAPLDAGPSGEHAGGNGSLMRILPLGLVFRDASPEALVRMAPQASRVTHGHPRCQVACAVYTLVIADLLRGTAPDLAQETAIEHCDRAFYELGEPELVDALEELRTYPGRTGSGFVTDAFWSAWEAFTTSASYEETVRKAVAYGNDTDTTAAIAGGLAGAHWGWDMIPKAWLNGMRGRDVAQPLVDRLVRHATGARTSSSNPLRVIPLADEAGDLGITFLPGKKIDGYTGLHHRDLPADIARLEALGVDVLVELVEDFELARCGLPDFEEAFARSAVRLVRYPIVDLDAPPDMASYLALVRDIAGWVRDGRSVAVACRGGLDRSGMTAACVLVELGLNPETAIDRVHQRRHRSLTVWEEQEVVRRWERAAS